ncbi:MAG: FAD-dependent oxidoreductase, partial [Candidatus Saccharimonadales bacterium]
MNNARIPTPATPPSSQGEILSDGVKKFTVIGAGVIGLLTALELKERGHSVEVVAPNAHTRGGH